MSGVAAGIGEIVESNDGSHSASSVALSLNTEAGDDEIAIPIPDNDAASLATTEVEDDQLSETDEYQTSKENSPDDQSMYKASVEGDWAAAKMLMKRDTSLAWRDITEAGDRALHLAVSKKNTKFVRKLIRRVGLDMLELFDGYGYTACCYAAMAGIVDVAEIMMNAKPSLVNVKNWYGTTPFTLAISYGKAEIASYFLNNTEIKGLEEGEWFDLLLVAITSKMFDVALRILENKESLAVMKGPDDRTALHVLSHLDISSGIVL